MEGLCQLWEGCEGAEGEGSSTWVWGTGVPRRGFGCRTEGSSSWGKIGRVTAAIASGTLSQWGQADAGEKQDLFSSGAGHSITLRGSQHCSHAPLGLGCGRCCSRVELPAGAWGPAGAAYAGRRRWEQPSPISPTSAGMSPGSGIISCTRMHTLGSCGCRRTQCFRHR